MIEIPPSNPPPGAGVETKLRPLNQFGGSLAQCTYLSLKQSIMTLCFSPGEILRKGEICAALGVSRSPVSEALTRLAGEGLVVVVPQAGTYVALFSMSEIREGAFLREALELAAVEHLAKTVTEAQLVQLRRNLRVQEAVIEDGDFAGFYQLDGELHEMLLSFTGYRRLSQVAQTAWLQVDRARQLTLPKPGRLDETLIEHRRILEALEARDPERARTATRAHLSQLTTHLEPLEREWPDLFDPA